MTEALQALRHPGSCDGIDVSTVQGKIDFDAVRKAGLLFAFAKASEGVGYCDPRVLENLAGFRSVGMIVSVYGFARCSQERAIVQAKRLADCAGDVFVPRPALDLESAPGDWSAERIVAFGEEFACELSAQGLLTPIMYTYPSFASQRLQPALSHSAILSTCPLWLASYRSTSKAWAPAENEWPKPPAPWASASIWQYSGNGGYKVPGIAGDCDRNLFRGDYAALRDFFGLPPEPDTLKEIVRPASLATDGIADELVAAYQRDADRERTE